MELQYNRSQPMSAQNVAVQFLIFAISHSARND